MFSTLVKEDNCRIIGCWEIKGRNENARADNVVTDNIAGLELSDIDAGY